MKTPCALPLLVLTLACRPVGSNYQRPQPALPAHYAVATGASW